MTTEPGFNLRVGECAMGRHDWRIDPYTVLTSQPARRRVVCADCRLVSSRPVYAAGVEPTPDPADPKTWPAVGDAS